jgi:hypothetical protein
MTCIGFNNTKRLIFIAIKKAAGRDSGDLSVKPANKAGHGRSASVRDKGSGLPYPNSVVWPGSCYAPDELFSVVLSFRSFVFRVFVFLLFFAAVLSVGYELILYKDP